METLKKRKSKTGFLSSQKVSIMKKSSEKRFFITFVLTLFYLFLDYITTVVSNLKRCLIHLGTNKKLSTILVEFDFTKNQRRSLDPKDLESERFTKIEMDGVAHFLLT
jgi:hypothetical protein